MFSSSSRQDLNESLDLPDSQPLKLEISPVVKSKEAVTDQFTKDFT